MYHPTGRVLTLLEIVQARPGITGPELAARLETDVRTVRRYVTKLQDVGIPIAGDAGRYGGYRLRPGYRLPPLVFSEEEATAVVLGLLGSQWLQIDQPKSAVAGALAKITGVLPERTRRGVEGLSSLAILPAAPDGGQPGAKLIITLSEAVHGVRCLDIEYHSPGGEVTRRTVEPYGLVGRQGRWYLIAYCRLRLDYRTFRLDRIGDYAASNESFSKDETFDWEGYASSRLAAPPEFHPFTVRFDARPEEIRRLAIATSGRVIESDQGVLFESTSDDFDMAAIYLLWTRLPLNVIDPPELREAFLRLARVAERAGTAPGGVG